VRSGLIQAGILTLVLASCAFPTAQEANDAVLTLRQYEGWAWAVGIVLIWADVLLPVPQTAVIAALGIIYGTLLGGLLGSLGLITGGLLGYGLMFTAARRLVQRFAGHLTLHKMESFFDRSGAWAIILTRSLPYSIPEAMAFLAGLAAMPVPKLIAALTLGSVPTAFVFAAIGSGWAEQPILALVLSYVLPILLLPVALYLLRFRGRGRTPRRSRARLTAVGRHMDNQSIDLHKRMERVRGAYDAVAARYADAMVNELDERPIERGLLDEVVRAAREGVGGGPIADVGCGPGHVAGYLADRGADVLGFDLSPAMIDLARARSPGLDFRIGSMLAIDAKDAMWSGAVALYSLIHFAPAERIMACRELARVLRPNAPLLVSFHVSSADYPTGSSVHLETWFEMPVDLTGYFLDPDVVLAEARGAGFELRARLDREPLSANEYPSRRCYLLLRRAIA
jgi:uncharacterized membrane protein YdjX (TVP38/TMEM64 family)/SAM-dependent methyltransferase